MDLHFDDRLIANYHSNSQIARVLTEEWVSNNMFCPRCGNLHIEHFENNRPVADFYCANCHNEYELKSKNGALGRKINDGAYETMISRITGNENPDFFFMSYSREHWKVNDLIFIPKHFFVPDIIEKRNPLSPNSRRAGWTGCNILLDKIPKQGRIYIVNGGIENDIKSVISMVNISNRLEIPNINSRGWLMDVLNCVNKLHTEIFSLAEMYAFESELYERHPRNKNVKPKIRQQLQLLRDKGFIEFLGNGKYRKIF